MKDNNLTGLRETLEQLTTPQLDEMLHAELKKEPGDPASVRLILSILEDREADVPLEMDEQDRAAWEKYQQRLQEGDHQPKPARIRKWMLSAASVVVILGVLFLTIPQQARAETFFEMLSRWTNSFFSFFSASGVDGIPAEYTFKTDNPGLQEVYDAVVELGVTEPVVPMWLPEGYKLVECMQSMSPRFEGIVAAFSDGSNEIVFKIDIYDEEVSHEYYKDENQVTSHEKYGIKHYVMRNNNRWVVIWPRNEKIECFLTLDCQEDILHKIIESIYVMEDNE